MKYWLSHLPCEVWVDCYRYPWISREELGRIVDRFRNRKYAEYLQFFLHDFCKVELGAIQIIKHPEIPDAMIRNNAGEIVEIAQTPMPGNIKGFNAIMIDHFDNEVLEFCDKLRPLFDNDVKMVFLYKPNKWESKDIVLHKLLPIIGPIRSIGIVCVGEDDMNMNVPHFRWDFNQPDFQAAIAKTNILGFFIAKFYETCFNFLPQWLIAERAGNVPRLVVIKTTIVEQCGTLIEAIKQNFLNATVPSTFAVYVQQVTHSALLTSMAITFMNFQFITANEFELENEQTGERLVLRHVANEIGKNIGHSVIEIVRHKIGAEPKLRAWLKENEELVWNWNPIRGEKLICLSDPTIGLIDGMDAPKDDDEAQKPSTSKGSA